MESISILNVLYVHILSLSLMFTRIFMVFYTFSILRREMATIKIITVLSIILSYYALLLSPPIQMKNDFFNIQYLLLSITQLIIGFTGGLILNIGIEIFTAIGQIISTQIGLSTASLFDPKFGMITSLTNFYIITSMILFFQLDAHLYVIKTITQSFSSLPVTLDISQFTTPGIMKYAAVIFTGSMAVSITLIVANMLINICLAVLSKFAPQFNLFSIGLNMSLIVGLFCIFMTFPLIIERGEVFLKENLHQYHSYFFRKN